LKGIIKNLNDGNQENKAAICGKLQASMSEVNAKEDNGDLTVQQATKLRQLANAIAATQLLEQRVYVYLRSNYSASYSPP
jgi:hypothetical protein